MSHEAASLARAIAAFINGGKANSVVLDRADLVEMFGAIPSLQYADWLTNNGLRMLRLGKKSVEIGLQVPPQSDTSAV